MEVDRDPSSDHMEWTPTKAEDTIPVALTPYFPSSPPAVQTPAPTPTPVSPSQERLRRQSERQAAVTGPPPHAWAIDRPVNERREALIQARTLRMRQEDAEARLRPQPPVRLQSQSLITNGRPAAQNPNLQIAQRPVFRFRPDTPYQRRTQLDLDDNDTMELDSPLPLPPLLRGNTPLPSARDIFLGSPSSFPSLRPTHSDIPVPFPNRVGPNGDSLLFSRPPFRPKTPRFNPPNSRPYWELPLFQSTPGGTGSAAVVPNATVPRPAAEVTAVDAESPRTSLKRKHDEAIAAEPSPSVPEPRPRLHKRVCNYLFSKVFACIALVGRQTAAPAVVRRPHHVPGAWPVTPSPERHIEVDTQPPISFMTPALPLAVEPAVEIQQHVVEAAEAEPAAVEVPIEAAAAAEPLVALQEVVEVAQEQPEEVAPVSPVVVQDDGEVWDLYDHILRGSFDYRPEPAKPRAMTATRRILYERKQAANEEKELALAKAREEELERARVVQEAINDELSFLDDAPGSIPARRVHFEESAFFEKPFPRTTRYYDRDEPIGHPVSPMGRPAFLEAREAQPPFSPSDAGTPAHAGTLPRFELSPAVPPNAETPPNLRDLGARLDRFEVSSAHRLKRENKVDKARLVAEEIERLEQGRLDAQRKAKEAARLKAKIVKELSEESSKAVQAAMNIRSRTVQIGKSRITRKDFGTLLPQRGVDDPKGWLNDEVVNDYLEKMVQRALEKGGYSKKADEVPRYHAFNTNLYTLIKDYGFQKVARWPMRAKIHSKRIFQCEQVLIPVNTGIHWALMTISGTNKTISYYDSMSSHKADVSAHIAIARTLLAGSLGPAYKEEEWKAIDTSSVQQANALDCGVFVCMNSLALMSGKDPLQAFDAADMPAARRQIAATLHHGGFTNEFDF